MRICTITCSYADNQGALLQTYALASHLQKEGHEVQVIDYRPGYISYNPRLWYVPRSPKALGKLWLQYPERKRARKAHLAFSEFARKYIPLTEKVYYHVKDLRQSPPEADLYLAGSDQIWNTDLPNGTDPAFYLDFGPASIRRESYAASFGTVRLKPGTENLVRDLLSRFDRITVRESSGLKILESLGLEGELLDDPVFLLSAGEWEAIADGTGEREGYVLVYDFFADPAIRRKARERAGRENLKIFSAGPFRYRYADRDFSASGPETFVSLVKNAKAVVTNSFHAVAFSLIFGKEFEFVPRPDGLNDRIADLLQRRGIRL